MARLALLLMVVLVFVACAQAWPRRRFNKGLNIFGRIKKVKSRLVKGVRGINIQHAMQQKMEKKFMAGLKKNARRSGPFSIFFDILLKICRMLRLCKKKKPKPKPSTTVHPNSRPSRTSGTSPGPTGSRPSGTSGAPGTGTTGTGSTATGTTGTTTDTTTTEHDTSTTSHPTSTSHSTTSTTSQSTASTTSQSTISTTSHTTTTP